MKVVIRYKGGWWDKYVGETLEVDDHVLFDDDYAVTDRRRANFIKKKCCISLKEYRKQKVKRILCLE